MSYAPRGPGRPQEPPHDSSNSFSKGSVRAARERLAQAQERLRKNQSDASDTSSLRSQFTMRPPPLPEPPGGLPSPQWPLMPATMAGSTAPAAAVASQDRRLEEHQHPGTAFYSRPGNERQAPPSNFLNPDYLTTPDRRPESSSEASLGSIPDFPIPDGASANRRPPVVPPPPVAYPPNRRTASSSHFARMSNVSPIPEETDARTSFKSYASSNVIPSNDLGFFYEEGDSDEEDVEPQPAPSLVRQASLGKRGKPTVTSLKAQLQKSLSPSVPEEEISVIGQQHSQGSLIQRKAQGLSPDTLSPSDGSKSAASYEREIDAYLKELETGTREPVTALKQVQRGTLAERVGNRRPPRLNMEATRAAEARASLTSLPDLIRRATKLAANLDRGKTASRLGMDWMLRENGHDPGAADVEKDGGRNRRPRSPEIRKSLSPRLEWPSGRSSRPILDSEKFPSRYRQRTLCGLNQRSFTGIVLLLVLLISAAIVIPIALIVIPKQGNGAQADTTVLTCSPKEACLNGGVGVPVANGGCSCICSDGYTGSVCQSAPDSSCTTISVPGVSKASIGTEVAPVLLFANSNFSIPLQSQALLVQFAAWNMTCASQNALVTMPRLSKRSVEEILEEDPYQVVPPTEELELVRRQEAAVTSNGIVLAAAPTEAAAAPSSQPTVATAAGQPSPVTNSSTEDFGKAGVLFVLQDSQSISLADQAQSKLRDFFAGAKSNGSVAVAAAQRVDLGGGYSIDLWDWTFTLTNGTVYGNGFNGTVTSQRPSMARRLFRRVLGAI